MPGDRERHRPELDDVFGKVLPDTTSDERDPDPPDSRDDDWYEHNRPPHHERDH